jgi:hypothetical protein
MPHFTYCDPDRSLLRQGDILRKSEGISTILEKVHPYFIKDDCKYFMVLTQSCDLERRDGKPCKAPYITIAAVKPLDLLIKNEIARHQTDLDKICGICNGDKRHRLYQFLERLLNNNEPDYFYLHDDAASGFNDKMVAFLRLSIAIKSDLYYEAYLHSKIIELTLEFKAKLGWLVGQMYSRVATPDWINSSLTKGEFKNQIDDLLDARVHWVNKKLIRELNSKYSEPIHRLDKSKCEELISSIKIQKDREIFKDKISVILTDFIDDETVIEKIVKRIDNIPLMNKFG